LRVEFEFNPIVKWLLVNKSDEKVSVSYLHHDWLLPIIATRPPFYANPQYKPYYPLI